jgi:hypothetical protein
LWKEALKLGGMDYMPICPNCKSPVREEAKYCHICGTKLSLEGPLDKLTSLPVYSREPSGNYRWVWYILSILSVVIVFIISWLYWQGYIFDKEPPKVFITYPPKDIKFTLSSINTKIEETIQIKATDNRTLDRVILVLNNSQIKSFDRKDIFSFKWKTSTKGRYVFKAVAYDRAGNKKESVPITITVKEQSIFPSSYIRFNSPIKTYINASDVLLREGPSINYRVIKILNYGEEVLVFGKWISTASNEAITTGKVTLLTLSGGSILLDRGKALWIIKQEESYYIVSTQIKDGKVTGRLPIYVVKSIFGEPWYYTRTRGGKEGWVLGEFLEGVEGSLE